MQNSSLLVWILVGIECLLDIYHILAVIFAKRTSRAMSIVLAIFGFVLPPLFNLSALMFLGELLLAPTAFGCFVAGILYSIKAHKLKSRSF